jgi:hypothetical protein
VSKSAGSLAQYPTALESTPLVYSFLRFHSKSDISNITTAPFLLIALPNQTALENTLPEVLGSGAAVVILPLPPVSVTEWWSKRWVTAETTTEVKAAVTEIEL